MHQTPCPPNPIQGLPERAVAGTEMSASHLIHRPGRGERKRERERDWQREGDKGINRRKEGGGGTKEEGARRMD